MAGWPHCRLPTESRSCEHFVPPAPSDIQSLAGKHVFPATCCCEEACCELADASPPLFCSHPGRLIWGRPCCHLYGDAKHTVINGKALLMAPQGVFPSVPGAVLGEVLELALLLSCKQWRPYHCSCIASSGATGNCAALTDARRLALPGLLTFSRHFLPALPTAFPEERKRRTGASGPLSLGRSSVSLIASTQSSPKQSSLQVDLLREGYRQCSARTCCCVVCSEHTIVQISLQLVC